MEIYWLLYYIACLLSSFGIMAYGHYKNIILLLLWSITHPVSECSAVAHEREVIKQGWNNYKIGRLILFTLLNYYEVIKSREEDGQVALIGELTNVRRILVGETWLKRQPERLSVYGWLGTISNLRNLDWISGMQLFQGRNMWHAVMNTVVNIRII